MGVTPRAVPGEQSRAEQGGRWSGGMGLLGFLVGIVLRADWQ